VNQKTSENDKNQKNSDQLDLSPENSPSKKNSSQPGTGSKIPVKRSPLKKQRAPQPPKQQPQEQQQQQQQQQEQKQQQEEQAEVKSKTENESKTEPDKSAKISSKIPLKKSDSSGQTKSPKEKTTSFPSNNNNNSSNGARKALFTSSNSQLNVVTPEPSKSSPKVSTTEIKPQVRKSPATISSTILFNQHQPLMESVPITVNSHIPSSGPNHALAVAAAKKASTSETGTQMDQPETKQNPDNEAKPEKKASETGSAHRGDEGKVEDQAKVGNNKPDKTVDGHVLHGSGKKWSYTDGKNTFWIIERAFD
jgi:hypothetical protein